VGHAVGARRGGASSTLTHQEREQALDQLLTCMDGFGSRDQVVVVAATNRADVLDPALLRPGRFDVVLEVGDFEAVDRLQILRIHARGKPLGPDVDLEHLSRVSAAMSGADLEQVMNDAALTAAKRAIADGVEPRVSRADLDEALARRAPTASGMDRLDTFLATASRGPARPLSPLQAELRLSSTERLCGTVEWADPLWIKVTTADGPTVINREHVVTVRPHEGTEPVDPQEILRVPVAEQPDAA
jgi:SpoVK/Ycf46/Vps4 family AAA+-type ATPase